ncbi:MFS transporter [Agromyces sp. NPDC057865]|uniref:MFS transporter n=1 Tax=Agromyces sp. NPDC057865 TaxID=3346267 RepID=UPI00366CF6E1
MGRRTDPRQHGHRSTVVASAALVVAAGLNLRDPITSVSATLDAVSAHYGLSPAGAAVLSSLPVLLLAVGAPLGPLLDRRFGPERSVLVIAAALVLAVALRPMGTVALFAGTIVAGAAISGLSVLMPRVIHDRLGSRAGLWSGVFSTSFGVSAALGAGFTVPLVAAFGSLPLALAAWAVPALLVVAVAAIAVGRAGRRTTMLATAGRPRHPLRAGRLLWQVTAFFGCQALVFFATAAWLPTLYVDRGATPEHAAALLAWLSLAGLPASLVVPVIAGRMPRQHVLVAIAAAGTLVGLAGVALAPVELAPVFTGVLGLAQGAAFGLGVALIVLKARSDVAAFSAFAQGFGYAFAALGPLVLGLLHAAAVPWVGAVGVLAAVVGGEAIAGWAAGRHVVERGTSAGGFALDAASGADAEHANDAASVAAADTDAVGASER